MRVRFKPDFFCRLIKDENQAPFGGRFQSVQPLRHRGDNNRLYGSVYRGNTAYDPSLPITSAWPSACRGRFLFAQSSVFLQIEWQDGGGQFISVLTNKDDYVVP